ncbi:hypothetical protein [Ottowia thiooxydans]|uniref:IPTL-CTERM protein sorting domain-containing protein n=1 Tax=Ottowia thiooxydans TaxID=219182 RepID=A0ABV2QAA9_9BURK
MRFRSLAILLGAAALSVAQMALGAPTLFSVNPFSNTNTSIDTYGLYALSPADGSVLSPYLITVAGRSIIGANGLAMDPTSHTAYAIVRASGVSGRLLITLDLTTGAGTEIGNLGDNFSSIAFRSDGQLFGVTGDGATVPETLYSIDKTTASKTLAIALGNGADGEVIAFNPESGDFHHFSGNGTAVYEKFPATAPYTPLTAISPALSTGEIFGAVWDPSQSTFFISDISSQLRTVDASGTLGPILGTMVNDMRGLILQLDQTITAFAPAATALATGTPVNLSATGGPSVSAVVFSTTSAASVCTVSGTEVTYVGPGTCTLQANQAGDASYWAAPTVSVDVVVSAVPPVVNPVAPAAVPTMNSIALGALAALLGLLGSLRHKRRTRQ